MRRPNVGDILYSDYEAYKGEIGPILKVGPSLTRNQTVYAVTVKWPTGGTLELYWPDNKLHVKKAIVFCTWSGKHE